MKSIKNCREHPKDEIIVENTNVTPSKKRKTRRRSKSVQGVVVTALGWVMLLLLAVPAYCPIAFISLVTSKDSN